MLCDALKVVALRFSSVRSAVESRLVFQAVNGPPSPSSFQVNSLVLFVLFCCWCFVLFSVFDRPPVVCVCFVLLFPYAVVFIHFFWYCCTGHGLLRLCVHGDPFIFLVRFRK